MIGPQTTIKRIPELLSAESDGEFLVLNPKTNLIYSLNETAKAIWLYTEHKRSVKQIRDHLFERFAISEEVLLKNLCHFITQYNAVLFQVSENQRAGTQ